MLQLYGVAAQEIVQRWHTSDQYASQHSYRLDTHLIFSASPRGDATTAFSYQMSDSAPPQVTRTVGSGLERETWVSDGLGRTVQDSVTLPGTVATTTTQYDGLGWKTFVSAPGSAAGTYFLGYDAFGRPTDLRTDGISKHVYLGYTGVRVASRTEWVQQRTQQTDAGGHQVSVVSELPAITKTTYDGRGRLQQVTDARGVVTHYHYGVGGRLASVLTASASGQQTRSYKYDGRGFLVREVSAEGGATSYRYDAQGKMVQRSTATGTVFASYDAAGRQTQVSSPASGSSVRLRQFDYDSAANGMGKLATAHAFNYRSADSCAAPYEVRQDMSYDPGHGRLAAETTTLLHGGALESWSQAYAYDGAGRITTTTYPYCQAPCPAPQRMATTAYGYGRPVSVSGFASSITYNPNGSVATVTHQNGVAFAQVPDPAGVPRPGSLGVQTPATPWPVESYSYDSSGNVTQIGGKSFVYDPDSRLVSATQPTAGSLPYQELAYDDFGNIVKVSRGTDPGNLSTYTNYDANAGSNQLTGASYDGGGRLHAYQQSRYLWDQLDQLTDVSFAGGETWVHTYDASGERTWSWRTSPSALNVYALRGQDGHVLSRFTKSGSTYAWEDYVYREGLLLGAQASSGGVTHFDVDHLGSLRLESDGSGHFTYHEYWPYGDEITSTASTEVMRFTGQERDLGVLSSNADDLDYMHGRYYKPLFSRFLSVDPADGDPAAPRSFNLYGYMGNRPLMATDPTGLEGGWSFLPVGMTPGSLYSLGGCFTDDCITVTSPPWQSAPGPNTGLWGLASLQAGSLEFYNGFDIEGGPIINENWHPLKIRGHCGTYWSQVKKRFNQTNDAIPGRTVPPFSAGAVAGKQMAEETGLLSARAWIGSGFKGFQVGTEYGVITLGRGATAGVVGLNSVLTYLAVSAAFEAGIGAGSLLGAGLDEATNCVEAYAP
jgi:RHS repeat-associated protein